MEVSELLQELDVEIDNRLQRFSNKQLRDLITVLAQNMSKQQLCELLCDDDYFSKDSLIKLLEKKEKKLLFQLLNEPSEEIELRLPLENWLKKDYVNVKFEVPYKIGRSKRIIDVLAYQKIGYLNRTLFGGWLDFQFIAIESKIKSNRGAIDKAFAQARDYLKTAQYSYVAISPYMFYKYNDVIYDKIKSHQNIGVLLVDKSRVIQELNEPTETKVDRETFEDIKEKLKI